VQRVRAMDDRNLSEGEERALQWLSDENLIQRNIIEKSSGKRVVIEHDLSGGLAALIRLLQDTQAPLHPQIRLDLARRLDPYGDSALQLIKRPSRKPGRPRQDSVGDTVRKVYEVMVMPRRLDATMGELRKKVPIPAAGMDPKAVRKTDAIKEISKDRKICRTKIYDHLASAKNLPSKSLKSKNK
jgi:hypothetical protein